MKKLILSVASIIFFGVASAQEVKFGAKLGVNLSTVKSSASYGDSKSLTGLQIGGLAEIVLNDKMSIQPELLFSQGGGIFKFTENISGVQIESSQEFILSKINIPVLFKYYVVKNLSLEAGPQLDYILSAKSDNVVNIPAFNNRINNNADLSDTSSSITITDTSNGSTSADVTNQNYGLKKVNFGFNLGAGYKLKNKMFFQARYTIGLSDFTDNGNFLAGTDSSGNKFIDNRYDNVSFKSSNFQFSVGYTF